jgi:hypothetical protein
MEEKVVVDLTEELLEVTAATVDQEEVDVSCQEDEGLTPVAEEAVDSLVTDIIPLEALVEDIASCEPEEERELQPF